jgi:hypothetical protein
METQTLRQQPLLIKRDTDIEKYKKTMQFIIDGWAAVRVAAIMADETGRVGTKLEFNAAIKEYVMSNPDLNLRDFGYIYILLKKKGWPDEIIEDVSHYFERGASLQELCEAYQERS